MTKQIKIGVVGCGYWGPNLIRNFRSLSDCNLKAMCDTSEHRLKHLKSLYPEVEVYNDYDRLLEGGGLDAVVVATPVKLHYPMAKASLLDGKHTFIEKPMARSSHECEELIDIAHKKGLVLMVGHTFLYSQAVKKIKEIVEHGDIGEIRYICARRLNLGLFQKDINPRAPKVTVTREGDSLCQKGVTQWLVFLVNGSLPQDPITAVKPPAIPSRPGDGGAERGQAAQQPGPAERNRHRDGTAPSSLLMFHALTHARGATPQSLSNSDPPPASMQRDSSPPCAAATVAWWPP